jgi:hypothetical protein
MFMDAPNMQNGNEHTIYDIHSAALLGPFVRYKHTAHVMVICRNSLNLSNRDPRITRQLVTNTGSVKMLCPQKIATHYIFLKTQHAYLFVF